MASHQFLLSREVCVMTPVTTSDKSDEALVKVVRLCWSLKPIDINLCRGRWLETLSEWQTDERMSEKERHKNHLVDVDMTNNRVGGGGLMIPYVLEGWARRPLLGFWNKRKQTNTRFALYYMGVFICVSW